MEYLSLLEKNLTCPQFRPAKYLVSARRALNGFTSDISRLFQRERWVRQRMSIRVILSETAYDRHKNRDIKLSDLSYCQ